MRLSQTSVGIVLVLVAVVGCSAALPTSTRRAATLIPSGTQSFATDLGSGERLDPTLGNPGYDVGHYGIDLTFDPKRTWLEGTVTIVATATSALTSVNVDFIGFDVVSVTINGEPASFARTERDMTIQPVSPISAGSRFELAVRYEGKPTPWASTSGAPSPLGWNISASGTSYVVSEPDGARSWFPCNDVPSDKATYTFRLTVPSGLVAAANGVLEDKIKESDTATWVWQMDEPMAPYLATVVIGDYEIVDDPAGSRTSGVSVRNLLPRDAAPMPTRQPGTSGPISVPLGAYDAQSLALQGDMIAFLAGYLGPFPYEAYGVALVPGFMAALEDQTLTVTGLTMEKVLVHELAHQWLGDDVSPAHWQDVWLSEGFATYMQWLWSEHRGEATVGQLAAFEYKQEAGLPPPGDPPTHDLFNQAVYGRGALTLYALRARIGDEAFFATLRAWVDRYGGSSATTEDFVTLAEEISGRGLTAFFQGWLFDAAMPQLPLVGSSSPQPSL